MCFLPAGVGREDFIEEVGFELGYGMLAHQGQIRTRDHSSVVSLEIEDCVLKRVPADYITCSMNIVSCVWGGEELDSLRKHSKSLLNIISRFLETESK